jgi:hypothetical protein
MHLHRPYAIYSILMQFAAPWSSQRLVKRILKCISTAQQECQVATSASHTAALLYINGQMVLNEMLE